MLYKDFIRHTDSCPFCDKSNNRMLLSTQHAYLTYNIAPYHTHHLLVIPHRHVESLSDLQDEEWIDIVYLQKKSLSILKKLGYTSMSCLVRE